MSDAERITAWLAKKARQRNVASTSRLEELVARYQEKDVGRALGGQVRQSEFGEHLLIQRFIRRSLFLPAEETVKEGLLSELRFISGIGRSYAQQLRDQGYHSITELLTHPRWKKPARDLLDHWGSPLDPRSVYRTLCRWLPGSHPLFLSLVGLVPREEIILFGAESLRLLDGQVFSISVGRLQEEGLLVRQYLARSLDEETTLLGLLGEEFDRSSILFSYNGKTVDWPSVRTRSAYYGLPEIQAPIHIDLLYHARRAFEDAFPDLKLRTVEERLLGVRRREDLPGRELPEFYAAYLETGSPGPLIPIINHNLQNVESLALLLRHLLALTGHVG